jgi:hyperosmotically inducible periplasmic protein
MRRLLGAFVVLTLVTGPALLANAADTKSSIGQKVDDAALLTKVKAKLTADKAKNLVHVNVDVKDGVVALKGSVPTEADKARAEQLAQATEGVKQVQNELVVGSPSASPSTK